jgi:hypothetical protein
MCNKRVYPYVFGEMRNSLGKIAPPPLTSTVLFKEHLSYKAFLV